MLAGVSDAHMYSQKLIFSLVCLCPKSPQQNSSVKTKQTLCCDDANDSDLSKSCLQGKAGLSMKPDGGMKRLMSVGEQCQRIAAAVLIHPAAPQTQSNI